MRAFVFTDPALTGRARQFVWLELNVDDSRNAAYVARLGLNALPTFCIVSPADETVVMRRVDSLTVAELGVFLDQGRAAADGAPPSSPLEASLRRADRLDADGKKAEAASAYRETIEQAPDGWAPYGRSAQALLYLYQLLGEEARCVALARQALPRLSGLSAEVAVARSGLDCALGLKKEDPERAAAVSEMERATRRTLQPPGAGAAADDRSASYFSLVLAREDAGDIEGALNEARAWASFLEAQATAARTAEQRAVFDSHRLTAYLRLGQPERALPMLERSERDAPGDYTPPARLAVAYFNLKRYGEALSASDRALTLVKGPRRVQVLVFRSDILVAKGDPRGAYGALEQAVACAESLPPGQRSEETIDALKDKRDKLRAQTPQP